MKKKKKKKKMMSNNDATSGWRDDNTDLAELIGKHALPCYVNLNSTDQLYLYKVFQADCLFARCYSHSLIANTHSNQLHPFRSSSNTSSNNNNNVNHAHPTHNNHPNNNNNNNNNNNYFSNNRNHLTADYASSDYSNMNTLSKESEYSTAGYSTTLLSAGAEPARFDIVSIPLNYQGLFEVFTCNSHKHDDLLDHEKDLISLATRLSRPKFFYVAKEMNVYEMPTSTVSTAATTSSSLGAKHTCKKMRKFKYGTICKAVRLVDIDYIRKRKHASVINYLAWMRDALCCRLASNRLSDMAIEFKLVDDLDSISQNSELSETSAPVSATTNTAATSPAPSASDKKSSKGKKSKLSSKKTYYLPIQSDLNKCIDLIPISSFRHDDVIESNSLQTIKHLISQHNNTNNTCKPTNNNNTKSNANVVNCTNKLLGNSCIELKLFEDHLLFGKASRGADEAATAAYGSGAGGVGGGGGGGSGAVDACCSDLIELNQHLEVDKHQSVFEVIELKHDCGILLGCLLNKGKMFFAPVDKHTGNGTTTAAPPPPATSNRRQQRFVKMTDEQVDASHLVRNFRKHYASQFETLADLEMLNFERRLTKMHTWMDERGGGLESNSGVGSGGGGGGGNGLVETQALLHGEQHHHHHHHHYYHNHHYHHHHHHHQRTASHPNVIHFADLVNFDLPNIRMNQLACMFKDLSFSNVIEAVTGGEKDANLFQMCSQVNKYCSLQSADDQSATTTTTTTTERTDNNDADGVARSVKETTDVPTNI